MYKVGSNLLRNRIKEADKVFVSSGTMRKALSKREAYNMADRVGDYAADRIGGECSMVPSKQGAKRHLLIPASAIAKY